MAIHDRGLWCRVCKDDLEAFTAQKLKLDRAKHQPVVAYASSMASQPTVVSSFVCDTSGDHLGGGKTLPDTGV